ncbi:MAG: HEAT repeat domain-containing protein, partial [Candidatus Wallbacteria bacterium]|nr:HEAT repeat domain-containing protein [Candidatus Wallbacteria bacterium]
VVELARSGHPATAGVLRQLAGSDPGNRVRYAARKLLDVLGRAAPAAVPDPALSAATPEARLRAVEALASGGDKSKLGALLERLPKEDDASVVAALVVAIGRLGASPQVPLLGNFLRDSNPRIRANAVEALGAMGLPVGIALVVPSLEDPDHRVRANAALVLERLGDERALALLERMSASPQLWMRDASAYALGAVSTPGAVGPLSKLLTDSDASVRAKAQAGLEKFAAAGDATAARLLAALSHPEARPETVDAVEQSLAEEAPAVSGLESDNPKLRMNIVNTIIGEKDIGALPMLVERLEREENEFVLSRMMSALGALGSADPGLYGPIAAEYLENPDSRVVANAIDALRALGAVGQREAVTRALLRPDARVKANAIRFLMACGGFDPRQPIEEMLASGDPRKQLAALHLAKELPQLDLGDSLRLAASSDDPEVRFKLKSLAEERARKGWSSAKALLEEMQTGSVARGEALALRKPEYLKRLWAWVADSVGLAVAGALLTFCAVVVTLRTGSPGESRDRLLLLAYSNAHLIGLAYSVTFFIRDGFGSGRGFGKRHMGLRVVDLETRAGCGYVKSMLRQSSFYLPGLNVLEVLWPLVDPRGQRLVDKLLGTMVVDEKARPISKLERWLLVGAGALALLTGLAIAIRGCGAE